MHRPGTPTPGYYLLGSVFHSADDSGYAMVLDTNGTPVWYQPWTSFYDQGPYNVDALSHDDISYTRITTLSGHGDNPGGYYEIHHLDAGTVDTVQAVGSPTDLHEFRLLPNGDHMLLTYTPKTGVDLTGLEDYGPNSTIADCLIQEIGPTGNLVWQWRASDHIDPVKESTVPGGDPIDVFHCNSIDVDTSGHVLLSTRNTDAVYEIDKATGHVVWKLGGTDYNLDGAQLIRIVGDPETAFDRQHDARFEPGGDISVFDDHYGEPGPARGVEYALHLDNSTATVAFQYQGPLDGYIMGNFRRFADGDSVIGWGLATGVPANPLALTEVDAAGNDVFDVTLGEGDASYRTVKVPRSTLNIQTLRLTAGLPAP